LPLSLTPVEVLVRTCAQADPWRFSQDFFEPFHPWAERRATVPIQESETLSGWVLLTIWECKVFLTSIFKLFRRCAGYLPPIRGRKVPDEAMKWLSGKTRIA
jgi:hypothetical protein